MRCGKTVFLFGLLVCSAVFATPHLDNSLGEDIKNKLSENYQRLTQGDLDTAEAQAILLLEQSRLKNDQSQIAAAQHQLGHISLHRNKFDQALRQFKDSLKLYILLERIQPMADLYADIGTTYRHQANYQQALDYHYRAIGLYQNQSNMKGVGEQQLQIGIVLRRLGQFESALSALQNALSINQISTDQFTASRSLAEIASVYIELGQSDQAIPYLTNAIELLRDHPDITQETKLRHLLAEAYLASNQLELARNELKKVLPYYKKSSSNRDYHSALTTLGKIELASHNTKLSQQYLHKALLAATEYKYDSLLTEIHLALAKTFLDQQDFTTALRHTTRGLAQSSNRNELNIQAEFYAIQVEIYTQSQQYELALLALRKQTALEAQVLDEKRTVAFSQLKSEIELERQAQSLALTNKNRAIELAKSEKRNLRSNLFFGSLVAFLLFAFLIWSRLNQRQRNDYLKQEVKARTKELEEKNLKLEEAYQTLEQASLRDPLTGMYNRHYLENQLPMEIKRAQQGYLKKYENSDEAAKSKDILCFLLDIDNFKMINDEYGHLAGDKVLVRFTDILRQVFRPSDLLIRWGGEEFLVVCRNIDRKSAGILAQRALESISSSPFEITQQLQLHVTCSIGFCSIPLLPNSPFSLDWEHTFEVIDYCLYAAKSSGKNCWIGVESQLAAPPANREKLHIEEKFSLPPLNVMTSLNNVASISWPKE